MERTAGRVVLARPNELAGVTCKGPECDKPARVHFLCNSHYYQLRRGNELKVLRGYKRKEE